MERNQNIYHYFNQNDHPNGNLKTEILKPFNGRKRSNKQENTEVFKVEKFKYESNTFSDDERLLFLNLVRNDYSLKNMVRISKLLCLSNSKLTKPTRTERRLIYGMFNWFKSNLQIIVTSFQSKSIETKDSTSDISDETAEVFNDIDSFFDEEDTFPFGY
jgi:hypothetical protein